MPQHLSPESSMVLDADEQERLRALNRSPHPYHHQNFELPHPSDRLLPRDDSVLQPQDNEPPKLPFSKESTPASDSGTDADDEHFLKGLPAPRVRPHKGVRGFNEVVSGTSTPFLSPGLADEDPLVAVERKVSVTTKKLESKRNELDTFRRKKVIVRRAAEVAILMTQALLIGTNQRVSLIVKAWAKEFQVFFFLLAALLVLYPVRLLAWTYRNRSVSTWMPFRIPTSFDPAPLLYPPAITMGTSVLVAVNNPAAVLPNIILSISSLPQQLIPKFDLYASYDAVHWTLSCLPLFWVSPELNSSYHGLTFSIFLKEELVLLYPLHQTLNSVLYDLTTTSLLTAELQLLSISLVNVLILSTSPQAQILKALLWGGGLGVLVFCGAVVRWGIALARVPKWRFRREPYPQKRSLWKTTIKALSWQRLRNEVLRSQFDLVDDDSSYSTENEDEVPALGGLSKAQTCGSHVDGTTAAEGRLMAHDIEPKVGNVSRRHTTSLQERSPRRLTHTPSGRKKRTTSVSMRAYFKLTPWQATVKKWAYAAYLYLSLALIILSIVRLHIQNFGLAGNEPIGWALGYFFGDLPWFRFQVVNANIERWICLPPRLDSDEKECQFGWLQQLRHDEFGEANTRLILAGYWVGIIIVGLAVVFQLKSIVEVDTRRKVFHFMMVGMLLPTIFVDPTYVALALSIVLAIFLMLDLLRASQLPPISKPIATFLAPYVDGRDFRGPVVISHIFLLIGCAIPLWLSLAALPRAGSAYLTGWEVPTRDLSMVAGVICVGLGDAAASLIGRRYGHKKWFWGGGKSIEGSVAFAAAVFVGLSAANAWLRVGRWPASGEPLSVATSSAYSLVCASMASLTEAVLTGGNDNVIVPVVLWTCVKALEI